MIALQLRHNTTTNNKTMPLQFICKCIQGLRNPDYNGSKICIQLKINFKLHGSGSLVGLSDKMDQMGDS